MDPFFNNESSKFCTLTSTIVAKECQVSIIHTMGSNICTTRILKISNKISRDLRMSEKGMEISY